MAEALEDVQDAILSKIHAGEEVDREEVLASHPEHADALREFFRVLDLIETTPPAADAAAPASLGEFRIIRELGRGGMGVVYEAEQASLKRRVALKVLPPALRTDPRLVARFQREAEAAGKLRHPGIVPVYSVGVAAGTPFFAMEMVEGRSLDAVLRDLRDGKDAGVSPAGATRRAWAVETVAKVADALDYAHGRGILHRDVKPGNIIIDGDGAPRLTDFGLALDAAAPGLTMSGEVFGSLHYMSPEQAVRRESPVDARTDVYSLAVTLYELLTLRLPYDGDTSAELLTALTTGNLVQIRDADASVPPALADVVMRAMSRDPAQRPATAAAFAGELRASLIGGAASARRSAASRARAALRRPWVRAGLVIAAVVPVILVALLSPAHRMSDWERMVNEMRKPPPDNPITAEWRRRGLSPDEWRRLADGPPGGDALLAKSVEFVVQSRPLISRKDLTGFKALTNFYTVGKERSMPVVALLSWEVSVDRGPWLQMRSAACYDFKKQWPEKPAEVNDPVSMTTLSVNLGEITDALAPSLAQPSIRLRFRGTFRIAPRPEDGVEDVLKVPGGTSYVWTGDETTYMVYDDYPADYPPIVKGPDVDGIMKWALSWDRAEYVGLATPGGGRRTLKFTLSGTHFLQPHPDLAPAESLPAACSVDLMLPGKDAVVATATFVLWAPALHLMNFNDNFTFYLPDAPGPDESRLLLDLQSGACKSLRLVFRPDHDVALIDPKIARYWGGTADVTIPVGKAVAESAK